MGGVIGGVVVLSAVVAIVWYKVRMQRPVENYNNDPVEANSAGFTVDKTADEHGGEGGVEIPGPPQLRYPD